MFVRELGMRFAACPADLLSETQGLLNTLDWQLARGWHTIRGGAGDEHTAQAQRHDEVIELRLVDITAADRLRQHPMFAGMAATSAFLYTPTMDLSPSAAEFAARWCAFSPVELARIESMTPTTVPGPRWASTNALVAIREHPLIEKLAVVQAVLRVTNDVWFIPKPDSTKYRARTLATMSALGVRVMTDMTTLEVAQHLAAESDSRHLVVVDDGGALIAAVAAHEALAARATCIETTARGRSLLREAGLNNQFIDLSGTATKLDLSKAIAVSCLREFLHHSCHRPLTDALAHVVGFGAIGRELALLLRAIGLTVTISDISPRRRSLAASDGFRVFDRVDTALAARVHHYLIGCSGHQTVDLRIGALLADGAMVCAASSQDLAKIVAEARNAGIARSIAGTGLEVRIPSGPSLIVLAEGNAINLFHAEGVPDPDFRCFENEVVSNIFAAIQAKPATTTNPAVPAAATDS
ncbi:hypothetical protein AWC15_02980 [Mycobacterium lacus]|uniref:Uncharacterized protein n=4 Tax=Mycobacterium lacus TaxID=169765 RepID=A0A1X1Y115_9MYCO|nr:hypothetical protein AWC15_02980 [Mycobacterium lacus]BBX97092.1 hypothetical protein MLAC_23860 [Mycobacterium lacus]